MERRTGQLGVWTYTQEIALMAVLFVGYRQIRFLTRNDTDKALANARRVLDVQQGWFVSERTGAGAGAAVTCSSRS